MVDFDTIPALSYLIYPLLFSKTPRYVSLGVKVEWATFFLDPEGTMETLQGPSLCQSSQLLDN